MVVMASSISRGRVRTTTAATTTLTLTVIAVSSVQLMEVTWFFEVDQAVQGLKIGNLSTDDGDAIACVAGGISCASAFVLVAKP